MVDEAGLEGVDHPALQINRPARGKARPRQGQADHPVLRAVDPGRPRGQVGFELQGTQMAPAPLRGVVMHRAFLSAMRAGKAGSRSVGQLKIDPLPGDLLHQ